VNGEGTIAGVDNGSETSMELFKASERKAFNGLCLAVIQSKEKSGNPTPEGVQKGKPKKPISDLKKKKAEENKKATYLLPIVKTVSDSFIFCYPLIKTDDIPENSSYYEAVFQKVKSRVLGLTAILSGISVVWSYAIMCGYTIRGAIDLGEVYWDENDLIGPAFITALDLESEDAKNSRIIISSEVNKLFKKYVVYHKQFFDATISANFRKDVDGYIIVDPNIMREIKDIPINELIKKLENSRDAIRDNATCGILKEKYNPLISMLRDGNSIGLKDTDVGLY